VLRHLFPDDADYPAGAEAFFGHLFDKRVARESIWVMDGGLSAAIWEPPAVPGLPIAAEHGSIGEQQRIAVARALLPGAELVVLDEPTAHQDDENAQRVIGAVLRAVEAGALVVISTHDPRLLEKADATLALGSG
jgi:ABC-type phosphate transport system ATPase subunit